LEDRTLRELCNIIINICFVNLVPTLPQMWVLSNGYKISDKNSLLLQHYNNLNYLDGCFS